MKEFVLKSYVLGDLVCRIELFSVTRFVSRGVETFSWIK